MHQTEAILPKLMCLHIVIDYHGTNFPADQYGRTITGFRIYNKISIQYFLNLNSVVVILIWIKSIAILLFLLFFLIKNMNVNMNINVNLSHLPLSRIFTEKNIIYYLIFPYKLSLLSLLSRFHWW